MARNPEKDILKNPTPTAGTAKKTVDGVLTALKIGNGMVSLLAGLLAAVMILYSGYVLYDSFSTEYRAYSSSWDLLKYKPDAASAQPSGGAKTLAEINEDYRAWLTIHETAIDYPVVQGEDDLYYAYHDVYKNTSLTGAIYQAAANKGDFSDSYNLVYGHHMDNGAMFGSLDKFRDLNYFKGHQTGTLVTKSGTYDVTLFAVVSTDAYENQIYTVGNRAGDVISFLTGDRSRDAGVGTKVLVYDADTAKDAVKILALSTCADAETYGRLVAFGKLTPAKVPEPTEMPTENPTETPTETPSETPTATPTVTPAAAAATATPEPKKTVKLTVRYLENDEEVFPTETFLHEAGDTYYVVSPQYPGYEASIEIVQGTIEEDMTVIVRYVPKVTRLTVQYFFMNGKEAAPTFSSSMRTGESYDIVSPKIDGYTATPLRVSGTKKGMDEHFAVIYVAEGQYGGVMTIDDYDTPLDLEDTHVQIGICFE